MVKRHKLFFISFFIGWFAVSITPFFDYVIVTHDYDLTRHRLGLPLPIIEQHTSLTPLEDAFPFELGLVSPQENPTIILKGNYFFLVVTAVVIVYINLFLIKFLCKRVR